jgi:hypothetical protein
MLLFLLLAAASIDKKTLSEEGFVTVDLQGQFGNQLFEIATAYAYALDHTIHLTIPRLFTNPRFNIGLNANRLFIDRILDIPYPRPSCYWVEPSLSYHPIPDQTHIHLTGYFQSEQYFQHRRSEILTLFTPPPDLSVFEKYPYLSDPRLVAVQIRDYRHEFPLGDEHPTHGPSYYHQAAAYFPPDSIFLVSTNNLTHAQECLASLPNPTIYLDTGDYIEEFFILTQCKSFIISNSSFGWWAAWLSTQEPKTVIAPRPWLTPPYNDAIDSKDLIPPTWITLPSTPLGPLTKELLP